MCSSQTILFIIALALIVFIIFGGSLKENFLSMSSINLYNQRYMRNPTRCIHNNGDPNSRCVCSHGCQLQI